MTELTEQLGLQHSAQELAQMSLATVERQIEQQLAEIERLENPLPPKQEKTVLASEQLAVMKKQQSKTPDGAKEQPQKRGKSAKKK